VARVAAAGGKTPGCGRLSLVKKGTIWDFPKKTVFQQTALQQKLAVPQDYCRSLVRLKNFGGTLKQTCRLKLTRMSRKLMPLVFYFYRRTPSARSAWN